MSFRTNRFKLMSEKLNAEQPPASVIRCFCCSKFMCVDFQPCGIQEATTIDDCHSATAANNDRSLNSITNFFEAENGCTSLPALRFLIIFGVAAMTLVLQSSVCGSALYCAVGCVSDTADSSDWSLTTLLLSAARLSLLLERHRVKLALNDVTSPTTNKHHAQTCKNNVILTSMLDMSCD